MTESLELPRVLVVDDEPRTLRVMTRVLESAGIRCLSASSAAEAQDLLRANPALEVVLSDIYMPTMNGIELLAGIRGEFADRDWLQLLLITGQASVETAVAAMRLEASDYLFKPVEPKQLREAVEHALARAASIRQVTQTREDTPQGHELHELAAVVRELAAEMRGEVQGERDEDRNTRALRLLSRLQESRTSIFGDAVMPEPAWEMLAELMRARLAGQHLSVTSLALASRSPTTTALRRIEDLIQGGLVTRVPDVEDRRRTWVELTPEGLARMQIFLEGFGRLVPVNP
jgi:CheY-like chemotaxis protein/DNA-binding MarR family transcriptional regulator